MRRAAGYSLYRIPVSRANFTVTRQSPKCSPGPAPEDCPTVGKSEVSFRAPEAGPRWCAFSLEVNPDAAVHRERRRRAREFVTARWRSEVGAGGDVKVLVILLIQDLQRIQD